MRTRQPPRPPGVARLARPVILSVLLSAIAPPQAGAEISITRWTIDGGGSGLVEVGGLIVGGTIGQPDAGRLVTSGPVVTGGFWIQDTPSPLERLGGPPTVVETAKTKASSPGLADLPTTLRVYPASPNPLLGSTTIAFDLPSLRPVRVEVFSLAGALVATLATGVLPAGRYNLEWGASTPHGEHVPAGLYVVRLRLGEEERTQKLVVLQ